MGDDSKPGTAAAALGGADIKALRIYPPLGIARVGNATGPDDYLITTEVMSGDAVLPNGDPARTVEDYRVPVSQAIKRHAARFRVYAELADGRTIELTRSAGASIRWRVAPANLKAGWYDFLQAMDLGPPISVPAGKRNRDNPDMPGGRGALDIVPAPVEIEGTGLSGEQYAFADGSFCGNPVYLGEVRTDEEGRLLVLGGHGVSASYPPGLKPTTFANNSGWHDDVSDGPVRAQVTLSDGTVLEAEPAWVAVTPPNFAPGVVPVVTMDDTVRETYMDAGWLERPTSSAFTADIWPIFDRLTGLQWVNHGLFIVHGEGSPLNARDPQVLARLRDGSPGEAPWRRAVLALFNVTGATNPVPGEVPRPLIPQIFGDAYGESETDARIQLWVTRTQYEHLERWAAGDFTDDWTGNLPRRPDFAALSPEEQVAQLERAALHDCLGGPFHPGIELTWTMRLKSVWSGPYRLNILAGDGPARQDYGDTLTPEACMAPGGPYDGLAAGALTRFLGVPWQTDGTSCNSDADYAPWTYLSMPTFWGARVPDQVFAEASYVRTQALDPERSGLQIAKHFSYRSDWLRDVRGKGYLDRLQRMLADWAGLGMVLPGPNPPSALPADVRVEQGRISQAGTDPKRELVAHVEALANPAEQVREGIASNLRLMASVDEAAPPRPARRRYRQDEV